MRVRRVAALLVSLTSAACGGHSTSAPTAPASTLNLAPGLYNLTLTMSTTGDMVCSGGVCSAVSLCTSTGGLQPVAIIIPTPAHVERAGDAVTVRPDDTTATFRMDLQVAGATVSGTASGQFRSGGIPVAVDGGTQQSMAVVTGALAAASASGKIQGSVSVGGSGCSNNGHTWLLMPR